MTRHRADAAQEFVDRVIEEAGRWRTAVPFDTVYLGGGTPSALTDLQLEQLSRALRARFELERGAAVTLEANPEDVTRERLAVWRSLGFTHLSLGVQALDDAILKFLGRRHRRLGAERALGESLDAGFAVSADLIFAVPGLGTEVWRETLRQVAGLGVRHLSCYELTIHEGTPFERLRSSERFALPSQEDRGEAFLLTHRLLRELGLPAYEVSNFARSRGDRSRHNQKYWEHAPYLGLGPSAHSFDGQRRWWNLPSLSQYLDAMSAGRSPVAGGEQLAREALRLEVLMLRLRTVDGLDLERFAERFGERLVETRSEPLEELLEGGFLELEGGRLRPTERGLAIADQLTLRLA